MQQQGRAGARAHRGQLGSWVNGIYRIKNQNREDLSRDTVYEFAWSFNPLPLKGATGSPGKSVAIA